ncbi:hypothetical protein BKA70DRAFT_605930 [Coprinopsis sp. MPI-PUGE-AT-0042]|nr:hypothetical protein BKA70DRAFT_605930 [Coprinopsis sp. MPI-PUGE-AT-0042]
MTDTQRLECMAAELLRCFIKPRWNDNEAVQLLVDLTSDVEYYNAAMTCFSDQDKDIWSQSLSDHGGALPLVASLLQSLVVRGWSGGVDLLLDLALHSTHIDTRDVAIRSLLSLSNNRDSWTTIKDGIESRIRMTALKQQTVDKAAQDATTDNWKLLLVALSTNATTMDFCSFLLGCMDNRKIADQDLALPAAPPQVELSDYRKQIENLSLHSNVHIRQAALEFLAVTIPERCGKTIGRTCPQPSR